MFATTCKRGLSLFLAVLLCFTAVLGFGTQPLSQPENSRTSILWRIPVREMPILTTAELGDMMISSI